jgi:hypothetical protein
VDREHKVFWVLLSLGALGGALLACFITFVWWSVLGDGGGTWFLALALIGVPPTFVALAQSIDGRGRPVMWLGASAVVYAVWYVIAYA